MGMTPFSVESWNRFLTHDLAVTAGVLGRYHEWEYGAYKVKIQLPNLSELPDPETFPKPSHARLFCSEYRHMDNGLIPVVIHVKDVITTVQVHNQVNLPAEIIDKNPNYYDGIDDELQEKLNNSLQQYGEIAASAFDQWLKTMRWKCQNAFIGRAELHGFQSGWGTRLVDVNSKRTLWIESMTTYMKAYKPISEDEWNEVQAALTVNKLPPIYYDLMFDGEWYFRNGDFNRAVTDFAVASEACLRELVLSNLPSGLQPSILKFIDEANVRQVINNFIKDILNEDQLKELKSFNSNLQQLFNDRNTILHSGTLENLSHEKCQKYLETTRFVISLAG